VLNWFLKRAILRLLMNLNNLFPMAAED
jgi:hypothetical protein